MEVLHSFILLIFYCTNILFVSANPCLSANHKNVPDLDVRMVNNQFDPSFGDSINDRLLTQGWYRAGNADMPTQAPGALGCGARFPIWMEGNIPTDGQVDRHACIRGPTDECVYRLQIKVKACGTYRVYYLVPPTGTDEGYCFGEGDNAPRPTYIPETPVLTTILVPDKNADTIPKLESTCGFATVEFEKDKKLMYQISWYFDEAFQFQSDTVYHKNIESIQKIYLDDSGFRMGSNISCSVRVKLSENGPPGHRKQSESIFLGIKVLTPYLEIQRGNKGEIRLQRTAPFGCYPFSDKLCYLEVILMQDPNTCTGVAATGSSFCGARIQNSHTGDILLEVEAQEEKTHYFAGLFAVNLQTPKINMNHRIWESYKLPEIKVRVLDSQKSKWSKKMCRAQNDPHMLTFDKRPYDFHAPGEYILYINEEEQQEVQTRFASCNWNNQRPYCTCGVAVRAGRDVFVIDRCNNNHKGRFYSCYDGVLKVEQRHDLLYIAYLPTGTNVHILFSGSMLNVQIYPSVRDIEKTKGLCGTLNDNCPDDFQMKDGTVDKSPGTEKSCDQVGESDYGFQPNGFSKSWGVFFEKSLFNEKFGFDKELTEWSNTKYMCTCKYTEVTEVKPEIDCTSSKVSTCKLTNLVKHTGSCNIKGHNVLKRWAGTMKGRTKREAWRGQHTKKTNMTNAEVPQDIESARIFCQNYAEKSLAFKLCSDIPNVDPVDSIQLCAMDIILSNSTDWLDDSREAMKERCMVELRMNTTLQETENGAPSVAEIIQNVTCPGECMNTGTCVNGHCKCDKGFGGPDCSINLSIPPFFGQFSDGFICDTQQWKCDFASIDGEGFVEEGNPTCKIRTLYVQNNGSIKDGGSRTVQADIQTYLNLFCPLSTSISKRSVNNEVFVKTYEISLSNDGVNFGDPEKIHIIDSSCQEPVMVDGQFKFVLKDGYCFINGKCVLHTEVNRADICLECKSDVNLYDWSKRSDHADCISTKPNEDTSSYAWVAGVVVGTIAAIVVISIVIWRLHVRKSGRIKRSSVFVYPGVSDK